MHFGVLSIFQNYRSEQDDGDVMRGELALALVHRQLEQLTLRHRSPSRGRVRGPVRSTADSSGGRGRHGLRQSPAPPAKSRTAR